jgi:hypothetical protein
MSEGQESIPLGGTDSAVPPPFSDSSQKLRTVSANTAAVLLHLKERRTSAAQDAGLCRAP